MYMYVYPSMHTESSYHCGKITKIDDLLFSAFFTKNMISDLLLVFYFYSRKSCDLSCSVELFFVYSFQMTIIFKFVVFRANIVRCACDSFSLPACCVTVFGGR